MTMVKQPPPWLNQDIQLYHGTTEDSAHDIVSRVRVEYGRPNADFGRGFYTTTSYSQAARWASYKAARKRSTAPAVVGMMVPRETLAHLDTLVFVRGNYDAEDYWGFVGFCRGGPPNHGRPGLNGLYDIVYGPVSKVSRARQTILGADQISFHSPAAEEMLNSIPNKSIIKLNET